jgi:hypothetical protein
MKIHGQEELFEDAMSDTEENVHQLFLLGSGIRMRFWPAEKFFGKVVEERYHRKVLKGEELKKTRPIGADDAQRVRAWAKELEDNELQVASCEKRIAEIRENIRMELAADYSDQLPMTFDTYAGAGRLVGPDGKPLTKKKVVELARAGKDERAWPYLYVKLGERMELFEATEELTMIPRILEIAAEDMERPLEELVEDEGYIADLAHLLINNSRDGLRDYIDGYRPVRIIEKKTREIRNKKRPGLEVNNKKGLLPIYPNGPMLLAGWEIILTPDDGAQIAQDDDLKKAFNVMIKPYVQKGIPTMNPNGGPIEMVQVKVIEEEKVEELKNKVTEFCEEYRLNRRHR